MEFRLNLRLHCFLVRSCLLSVFFSFVLISEESIATPKDSFPYSDTIAEVSEYVAATMKTKQIEGLSIALMDHEEIAWAQGFGWADKANGMKVTTNTIFHIGSVSKILTTASVMVLVDEGKVDLDQPVKNYLPAFSLLSPSYEQVTVRMLLNHQSGIPGALFNYSISTKPLDGFTQRVLDWLPGEYAQYSPGYFSVYCNNGFTLLEEIVRVVSGQTYLDFVKERILEKLGMSSTGYETDNPEIQARLSKAYMNGEEMQAEYLNFGGTGGFSSTPTDMCHFLAMIAGDGTANGQRILTPESVAMMCSDQTLSATVRLADGLLKPGLGWDLYADPEMAYAGPAPAKGGDTVLFGSQILVLPDYHLGAVVTMNLSGSSIALSICEEALMAALEERYSLPRPAAYQLPAVATPAIDMASLEGIYASNTFGGLIDLQVVAANSIQMWVTRGDSYVNMAGTLTYRENGWFYSESMPTYGFSVDELDGQTVLLAHSIGNTTAETLVVGERLDTPPDLSDAWTARLDTQWLAVNLSPMFYTFDIYSPLLVLRERSGWLTCEYGVTGSAGMGSSLLPSPDEVRVESLLKSLAFKVTKTTEGIPTTSSTQVIVPLNDDLAWTPQQFDCRELTHLQVVDMSGEEWLRFGSKATLQRPLNTVPVLTPGTQRTVDLVPDMGQWFKLADGTTPPSAVTVVGDPEIRWGIYNDELRPIETGWGGFHYSSQTKATTTCWYLYLATMKQGSAVIEVLGASSHQNWARFE